MTELRDETAVDRTVANGRRTGQAAEQTWEAVLGASGTAQEGMRRAHDATIDVFKQWSDRVAGTPDHVALGRRRGGLLGRSLG
jgi:hypothetical protein